LPTVNVTGVHYKVLDGAYDGGSLGHLLMGYTVHPREGEPFEGQPETSVQETSAALLDLLRAGLVELRQRGAENPLPQEEAEAVAVDPASWIPPVCWDYEPSPTPSGEAALLASTPNSLQ
jgi:hypothetical protein